MSNANGSHTPPWPNPGHENSPPASADAQVPSSTFDYYATSPEPAGPPTAEPQPSPFAPSPVNYLPHQAAETFPPSSPPFVPPVQPGHTPGTAPPGHHDPHHVGAFPPPQAFAPQQALPPQQPPQLVVPPQQAPPTHHQTQHHQPQNYQSQDHRYPSGPIPSSSRNLVDSGGGWRRALKTVSGGLISFGASKSQQQLELMVSRAQAPIHGEFRLAILSMKGGVGKTTTTLGLGSAFASLRGDRVIAVDANPDLGTLGTRIPQQTAATIHTLLADQDLHVHSDIRRHTSQAGSRLEILASDRDPAVASALSGDDYRRVQEILTRYYQIIISDCGTGVVHPSMEGILGTADALVVVTSAAVDGARSASATLEWLSNNGYQHLAGQAVVVVSSAKPGGAPIDLDRLTEHFLGRARAVQIIPFDEHLGTGSFVDLDQMNRPTRTAFLELAATVADSFPRPIPPPGLPAQGFPPQGSPPQGFPPQGVPSVGRPDFGPPQQPKPWPQ